ncbi:ArpU family phage packaging/lysis transcriptional regulator [Vagococcus elongatus]|uniref:Autolysin n=1 Tax=Vagococcus elongatus TaxID=180344 RepID=A0A430AU17_9ENTE|nr:ArpU family phage packaging/lysis transcriptional regulator [Vagococcus elongatus]RSU11546.1 hypothetical protein CBF29_07645 [Vagococcus elongatus]
MINTTATKQRAKEVLSQYRRFQRIAGKTSIDLTAKTIDTPYQADIKKEDENTLRSRALVERNKIDQAIVDLEYSQRLILYYSFCSIEKYTIPAIAAKLNHYYSTARISSIKSEALVHFAEAYDNGKLLVME